MFEPVGRSRSELSSLSFFTSEVLLESLERNPRYCVLLYRYDVPNEAKLLWGC